MVVLTRRSARLAQTSTATTGIDHPADMDVQILTTTTTMKPRTTKRRSCLPTSQQRNGRPGSPPIANGNVARVLRRPIRPVDRQKMVDWLVEKLNGEELTNNLWWLEKRKTFAVKWSHASRHGFSLEERQLVKAWAKHSGIFQDGDEEDHKKWKANFRCALHSLREIEEITPKDGRKGQNAMRTYKILEIPREKKPSRAKTAARCESSDDDQRGDDSDSGHSADRESMHSLPSPVAETCTPKCVPEPSASLPNFQTLGISTTGMTFVQHNHFSGGCMTVKEDPLQQNQATSLYLPDAVSSSTTISSSGCSSPSFPTVPSYPIPAFTTLPAGLLQQEEMDGMRPVGIMMHLKPRDRTPSGDSGHPQSPPKKMEDEDIAVDEEGNVYISELVDVVEEISADEGIEVNDISQEIMEIVEAQNIKPVNGSDMFWSTLPNLPPSNVPEAVITLDVNTTGDESHDYTSLDALLLMDTK